MSYTINPNAKNKWARNAENTMDLSLETDASSVYLDNGRTLEQEIGEGSIVSNVATVDTSMSKVIDGTLDGAYESGVMYGRSLVNLSNLHKSFNDTTLNDYYVDTSLCETSKLKLGTPYTLVFYTTVHGGDHDIYGNFELGVSDVLHSTNAHPNTTTSYDGTLVKNGWSKMCVTFTDFLGYKYLSLRPIRCSAPESGKSIRFSIEGFILLEGDWSNKDLPFNDYFDGINYCKMPILRNVGKNLFNGILEMGGYRGSDGSPYNSDTRVRSVEKTFLPKGTYTLSSNEGTMSIFTIYDLNGVFKKEYALNSSSCSITLDDNSMVHICVENENLLNSHIQLEEGSAATPYEPYKSNILSAPEDLELRGIGNVKDTLDITTGEKVERIGEVVLNGSEDWAYGAGNSNETIALFYLKLDSNMSRKASINDKLPSIGGYSVNFGEGIYIDGDINIRIKRNKLNGSMIKDFKQWLSQNPITVQYELAEPITTIVEPLTIPFAYQNGHIILESGYEGQSLLPTLEYSTVVNKTGLIENVAKTIQRQEKQLTMLEKMLIQNIINLDYNNTLLTLKNEMEEML